MTLTHALCRVHHMSLEKQSLPAAWNAVMNGEPVADIAAALEAVRAIAQVRARGPPCGAVCMRANTGGQCHEQRCCPPWGSV